MIPARIDVSPQPRVPTQARGAVADRDAPEFDDALREHEQPAVKEKDEPEQSKDVKAALTGDALPLPNDAPGATPLAALETLLAQVLPQQAPAAPRGGPVKQDDAETPRLPVAASDVSLPAASAAVEAEKPVAPAPVKGAFAQERRPASDQNGKPDLPAPVEAKQASPRDARHEAKDAHEFRPVAVRHVSTTTHFPVVADPVKQIATEVTRALDGAAATSSAPVASQGDSQPVKTLHVQLEPESLGTVTLRMRLSGNQLSVRVDVAEPATLDMIQREHDRLQKSMATDRVSVDRLEIRAAGDFAPVQSGDSASAPKQDMNAQGQQTRSQGEAASGQGRGRDERRNETGSGSYRNDRQDAPADRSSDSRGLYL